MNTIDNFIPPVSVADLPADSFSVGPDILTEEVVRYLDNNPNAPGVMIVLQGKLFGVITRQKLFERLGHRYGIELFLRKPIRELMESMRTNARALDAQIRIEDAIQQAMARHEEDTYDPIVIEYEKDKFRLVDMKVMLIHQSRTVLNLSDVVGKLESIDRMIVLESDPGEIFQNILHVLRQSVPYHQGAILIRNGNQLEATQTVGYDHLDIKIPIQKNPILEALTTHRQPIQIEKTGLISTWESWQPLGLPAAWLGVPILREKELIGLLSMSRNVLRHFTQEEKLNCLAFSQRIQDVLLAPPQVAARESQRPVRVEWDGLGHPASRGKLYIVGYNSIPQMEHKE